MRYSSKIDWWMVLALAGMPIANIWLIVMFTLYGGIVLAVCAIVFLLCNVFLIIPIWANTYYILDEHELIIRCGLGRALTIAYGTIKSVKETKNMLASSALSLDRIEIVYGAGGVVLISPDRKQEFLQQLELHRKGMIICTTQSIAM